MFAVPAIRLFYGFTLAVERPIFAVAECARGLFIVECVRGTVVYGHGVKNGSPLSRVFESSRSIRPLIGCLCAE